MIHDLKTWATYFEAVWEGRKTFEIRFNDREFKVGDSPNLMEYDPEWREMTGRCVFIPAVTYVLHGGLFGLSDDFVCMAFDPSTIKKTDER